MEINFKNLKKIYNYILLKVPQEKIRMDIYRSDRFNNTHECQSVGCVIGHCVILDKWENIPKKDDSDFIDFQIWSQQFTGLILGSYNWDWCFSGRWSDDKEQILLRLKYLIDNKSIPDEWNWNYIFEYEKLEIYELD